MMKILAHVNREFLKQFVLSNVLLAFDYDGTLAPIVDEPDQAMMRPHTRRLLQRLAALYRVVIISGRAQSDIMKRLRGIGVREIIGNHGIEPWRKSDRFIEIVQRWRPLLEDALHGMRGVRLEDKVLSLAVHFRACDAKKEARAAILDVVERLEDIRVIGGKDVINLLPNGAPDKGMALEKARERLGCDTALYVGDDDTDEDVFALDQPERLLSIRVTEDPASRAQFCIDDQAEIDELLETLIDLCPSARIRTKALGTGRRRR
jgi:trehalose 6-phosphate phosphatase